MGAYHEHEPKKCRWCGAPIYWARTMRGRPMPVDVEPSSAGNVGLVDRKGTIIAQVYRNEDECRVALLAGRKLRLPHHATCPKVNEWRKQA